MKCNIDKISNFFDKKTSFDEDIINFVRDLFEYYMSYKYSEPVGIKILFLGLNFYDVQKDDEIDGESLIVDFYALNSINSFFRKLIISKLQKFLEDPDKVNDFSYEFLLNDLKILVPYSKWKNTNRKNKLDKLDGLV